LEALWESIGKSTNVGRENPLNSIGGNTGVFAWGEILQTGTPHSLQVSWREVVSLKIFV
jgi:hypothetical protein